MQLKGPLSVADNHRRPFGRYRLIQPTSHRFGFGPSRGAVTGAAIGAAVEARNASRTDDVFFPQLAIVYGLGIGALGGAAVGGVLGAIYNGVAHPDSRD